MLRSCLVQVCLWWSVLLHLSWPWNKVSRCDAGKKKTKKLTKRKLECHVESEIRFDVELCSGIWGDHWRRRWFGEFYRIKLNRSKNEWLYLMAPLTKCSCRLSSTSSSPINLTILTCSNAPHKWWCMLFGTMTLAFLQKDGALLLKMIYNKQIHWQKKTEITKWNPDTHSKICHCSPQQTEVLPFRPHLIWGGGVC